MQPVAAVDQPVLRRIAINEVFGFTVRFASANERGRPASKRYPGMKPLLAPTMALAISCIANAVPARAQTPAPHPEFEVASVKQNTGPPGLVAMHFNPGGRFTATNFPLKLLVDMAYGVGSAQEHRVPAWVDSDSARYDITARAEGDPSKEETFAMIRTLLEDRFKLQVHREKKEVTVYALTVAKSGSKLKEDKDSGCARVNAGDLAPEIKSPVCGMFGILPGGLEGMKVTMTGLAGALTNVSEIGRPVIDKTGITQTFDVHIRWTPSGPGAAADNSGPSIFTALQEQLGLKLESQKGTDDVFVIDRAERPTEN